MSSFEEDKKLPEGAEIEEAEESTIFTASPTKKAPKAPPKTDGNKRAVGLIAAICAVAVLALSIFAVIVFIPNANTSEQEIGAENIPVTSVSPEEIKTVKITRKDSVSVYHSALSEVKNEETGEMETEVTWTIEGIDPSLTESASIGFMLDSAFSLYASRTIEPEEGADYGFSNPQYVVEMIGYNSSKPITLTIGKETPTKSGVYATLGNEIYLISIETAADFGKTDEQMATSYALYAATVKGGTLNYFSENKLVTFDKITLSGKNFPRKLTFAPSGFSNTGNYNDYMMTSPVYRYADTAAVGALLEIAASGLTAAEAYKFYPTAADIKKYRLDNPDMNLAIEFGSEKVTVKASRYDEEYFAVMVSGRDNVIFKVANSFLYIAEYAETDYANNLMFIENLIDLKALSFKTADKTYNFDVDYTEATEDEGAHLTVMLDGKKLTAENFQRFYQHLVVECNEKTLDRVSGSAVLSISAVRDNGTTTSIKFIKVTDRRYYVEVDSAPIGYISATKMDNILNYLVDTAADKEVPGIS